MCREEGQINREVKQEQPVHNQFNNEERLSVVRGFEFDFVKTTVHCVDNIVQHKETQYQALNNHGWFEVLIIEILAMGWLPEHKHQKQPHQNVSECLDQRM